MIFENCPQAIEANPKDFDAIDGRTQVLMKLGNWDGALTDAKQLIKVDRTKPKVRSELGFEVHSSHEDVP